MRINWKWLCVCLCFVFFCVCLTGCGNDQEDVTFKTVSQKQFEKAKSKLDPIEGNEDDICGAIRACLLESTDFLISDDFIRVATSKKESTVRYYFNTESGEAYYVIVDKEYEGFHLLPEDSNDSAHKAKEESLYRDEFFVNDEVHMIETTKVLKSEFLVTKDEYEEEYSKIYHRYDVSDIKGKCASYLNSEVTEDFIISLGGECYYYASCKDGIVKIVLNGYDSDANRGNYNVILRTGQFWIENVE